MVFLIWSGEEPNSSITVDSWWTYIHRQTDTQKFYVFSLLDFRRLKQPNRYLTKDLSLKKVVFCFVFFLVFVVYLLLSTKLILGFNCCWGIRGLLSDWLLTSCSVLQWSKCVIPWLEQQADFISIWRCWVFPALPWSVLNLLVQLIIHSKLFFPVYLFSFTELQTTSCFHCHTIPSAKHCERFLEISVWLWLYLHCDVKWSRLVPG